MIEVPPKILNSGKAAELLHTLFPGIRVFFAATGVLPKHPLWIVVDVKQQKIDVKTKDDANFNEMPT